jgi:hypothetical protein
MSVLLCNALQSNFIFSRSGKTRNHLFDNPRDIANVANPNAPPPMTITTHLSSDDDIWEIASFGFGRALDWSETAFVGRDTRNSNENSVTDDF